MDSKTDNLAVTEEAYVYETISIDLKKEKNTHTYKHTKDIDIDKINKYEERNKVSTTK